MRQIALDTETTGLEPARGHRVIEIGCVEILNRRFGATFQRYVNPEREVDAAAMAVHRITYGELQDKPLFADICDDFLEFVHGAQILIHNAAFDLAFLDAEFKRVGRKKFTRESGCEIIDTLEFARDHHPGLQNSLDALCDRYSVDNSQRDVHGALCDAGLLAQVYLAMTGGQIALGLNHATLSGVEQETEALEKHVATTVIYASAEELVEHERFVRILHKTEN